MPLSSSAVVTESLLEIDHCFICLPTAVETSTLTELGLSCASQPLHRAEQGTASQILFFENVYLELIWVESPIAAARYARQTGIDFLARTAQRSSPFGLALRQTLNPMTRPFDLLPPNDLLNPTQTFLNFATDNLSSQTEPLCFVIPDAISLLSLLDRTSPLHQQMIRHAAGMRRLTRVCLTLVESARPFSDSMQLLRQDGTVDLIQGSSPLLELSFDHRRQQHTLDLRWLGIPVVLNF